MSAIFTVKRDTVDDGLLLQHDCARLQSPQPEAAVRVLTFRQPLEMAVMVALQII